MTDETPNPKNITEAIARIMGELGGIGKDHTAAPAQGGYSYRGIEDITSKAQTLCSQYGVVFYPQGEITDIREITVNGKPWTDTVVSVEYKVTHGPSHTFEVVKVPGIGRDNADKGSNKGMTQAFKYALIQTFMISDPKDDGDRERDEADLPEWQQLGYASEEGVLASIDQIKALWTALEDDVVREDMKAWLKERGYSARFPVRFDDLEAYLQVLADGAGKAKADA